MRLEAPKASKRVTPTTSPSQNEKVEKYNVQDI